MKKDIFNFTTSMNTGSIWTELDELNQKQKELTATFIEKSPLVGSIHDANDAPYWLKQIAGMLNFCILDHELEYVHDHVIYKPTTIIKIDGFFTGPVYVNLLDDGPLKLIPLNCVAQFMIGYGEYLKWFYEILDIDSLLKTNMFDLSRATIDRLRNEIDLRKHRISEYSNLGKDIFERMLYILTGFERPPFEKLMMLFSWDEKALKAGVMEDYYERTEKSAEQQYRSLKIQELVAQEMKPVDEILEGFSIIKKTADDYGKFESFDTILRIYQLSHKLHPHFTEHEEISNIRVAGILYFELLSENDIRTIPDIDRALFRKKYMQYLRWYIDVVGVENQMCDFGYAYWDEKETKQCVNDIRTREWVTGMYVNNDSTYISFNFVKLMVDQEGNQ